MFSWAQTDDQTTVQYAYKACIRQVDCQACDARYYYRMGRMGQGSHQTSFTLSGSRDRSKASRKAMQHASRLLEREAEMVPCPACGHINHELIEGYANRYRLTSRIGWIAFWLGLLGGGMLAAVLELWLAPKLGWSWGPLTAIALALGAIGPCYGWLVMRIRRRRFVGKYLDLEPDTTFQLPVGTPPAMLEDIDDDGQRWLEVVSPPEVDEFSARQGLIFAHDNISFPMVCCACMKPVDGANHLALPDHHEHIPVCERCGRRVSIRQTILFLVIFTLVLLGYWVMHYAAYASQALWIFLLALPVSFIAAIGVINARIGWLKAWLVLPFNFRLVDPVRRIYHFKAKHPLYNLALLEHQLKPQRIAFDPDKDVFSHDIPPQAD